MPLRLRRLDDRIRELCARVIASRNAEELNLILPELRKAIHEATQRLRLRAVAILMGSPNQPNERRKSY